MIEYKPVTEGKKTWGDLSIEVVDRGLARDNTKFFVHFDHVINKAR
jgi:hypothetical protein